MARATDLPHCQECGTDDPMNDKLSWLTLAYDNGHVVMGIFCGGGCAELWLQHARERLLKRAYGD